MRRVVLAVLTIAVLTGCANAPVPTEPDTGVSAAPAAASRPTTTAAAAPRTTTPAPAPVAPAETFEGSGDDVVTLAAPLEFGVLTFDCSGCDGNVVVETTGALLVNEIGSYSGKRVLGARGETTSTVQVQADGDWTMTVGALDDRITRYTTGQAAQGSGDDVFFLQAAPSVVQLAHDGEANFVVEVLTGVGMPQLAANEIGAYQGRVALDQPGEPSLVEVTADGEWSITPQ